MKLKKIISALTASAVLATALPVYAGFSVVAAEGDTQLTALELAYGEVVSDKLLYHQYKWYKFNVPTTGKINLTISMSSSNIHAKTFTIIDEQSNSEVVSVTQSADGNYNYTYYLTAGDYCISLTTESGGNGTNYDMRINYEATELTFEGKDNNSINKASEIALETEYSAHIANNDSKDYYTFNLDEEDDIALNFEGDLDSIDWILYNNKNEEILKGTYTRDTDISDLIIKNNYVSLKSGKYTLAFNSNSDNYGTYKFSLSEYVDFEANGIAMADINNDGIVDATDATVVLEYYSYISTGGEERDMRKWLESKK